MCCDPEAEGGKRKLQESQSDRLGSSCPGRGDDVQPGVAEEKRARDRRRDDSDCRPALECESRGCQGEYFEHIKASPGDSKVVSSLDLRHHGQHNGEGGN